MALLRRHLGMRRHRGRRSYRLFLTQTCREGRRAAALEGRGERRVLRMGSWSPCAWRRLSAVLVGRGAAVLLSLPRAGA